MVKKKLTDIKAEMPETQKKIKELANKIRDFESEEDLKDIIRLLKNDVEKQSDYFANPVNLKENKLSCRNTVQLQCHHSIQCLHYG